MVLVALLWLIVVVAFGALTGACTSLGVLSWVVAVVTVSFIRLRETLWDVLLSRSDKIQTVVLNTFCTADTFDYQWLDLAGLRLLIDVLNEVLFALDSAVGYLADLFRVKRFPRLVIQVLVERYDVYWIYEIDKSVTYVTSIVQIERQIEKVVFALVMSVNTLQKHVLGVLVGYVTDHNRCPEVLTVQNSIQVDGKLGVSISTLLVQAIWRRISRLNLCRWCWCYLLLEIVHCIVCRHKCAYSRWKNHRWERNILLLALTTCCKRILDWSGYLLTVRANL